MSVKKKIRVLECIRQGQIGGGESHLLSLVENLDKTRFEPVVLSFTDGPMIDRLRAMNIDTHIIHTVKPFDISKWKEVKRFIRKQQVDLVHAHGTRANSNILWASRSLGLPVIYTVHGWSFHQDQQPLVKKLRIMGEKYLTKKSDLNISVSASNQQSGKQFIPSFTSTVVNNGIDQQKFNPARSFKNVREELGIDPGATLILFVARFTSHKQPLKLLEAFARIAADQPKLHLLMVGEGDQRDAAIEFVQRNQLEKRVTLSKFRQDVPDVLSAADIFVLPSLWEGLPIGLLEAMAMGKAIIATNVDGTSEIIRNEENGLLIETTNLVENLAKAITKLADNAPLRESLSTAAIKTVQTKYNAQDMTRHIEEIYTDLLNGRHHRSN